MAADLAELTRMIEAALPGVLNVVYGGDETGRALIDAEIDGAAFTGSAVVGLEIIQKLHSASSRAR